MKPCGRWPLKGWDKCVIHAGESREVVAARVEALEAKERAEAAVVTFGLPVDVDPWSALLGELRRTAGHVGWLYDVIQSFSPDDLVWGRAREGTERGELTVVDEAAPSVWYDLYRREREHLVRVSKTCLDAGIDERMVRVAEAEGAAIVSVIRGTLVELGVEVTEDVARVVSGQLRALEAGGG